MRNVEAVCYSGEAPSLLDSHAEIRPTDWFRFDMPRFSRAKPSQSKSGASSNHNRALVLSREVSETSRSFWMD